MYKHSHACMRMRDMYMRHCCACARAARCNVHMCRMSLPRILSRVHAMRMACAQVVTNHMHGYLRMRIAQFLTTVHTTPHVIYLSRHGQSEYNVLGKIGGNPPLSTAGEEYARRFGAWVPSNICQTADGRQVKARLWTSSLRKRRRAS